MFSGADDSIKGTKRKMIRLVPYGTNGGVQTSTFGSAQPLTTLLSSTTAGNMSVPHPQIGMAISHPQMMSMYANQMLQQNQLQQFRATANNGGPGQVFVRSIFDAPYTLGQHYDMLRQQSLPQTGMPSVAMGMQYPMMPLTMQTPMTEYRTIQPAMAPSAVPRVTGAFRPVSSDKKSSERLGDRPDPSRVYLEKRPEKRARANNASDEDDDDGSDASERASKRRPRHAPGQGGKRRLKIDFLNLGQPGADPQTCGKSGSIIPDGLKGRHEMHNQPWEFEVNHEKNDGVTVIKWSVTNLTSGKTVSVTETPFQAKVRQRTGNTITSFVMRQALEQRVREFEELLEQPDTIDNPLQMANFQSLIKDLRRKERNEGILFFGLRHEDVQQYHSTKEDREKGESPCRTEDN